MGILDLCVFWENKGEEHEGTHNARTVPVQNYCTMTTMTLKVFETGVTLDFVVVSALVKRTDVELCDFELALISEPTLEITVLNNLKRLHVTKQSLKSHEAITIRPSLCQLHDN